MRPTRFRSSLSLVFVCTLAISPTALADDDSSIFDAVGSDSAGEESGSSLEDALDALGKDRTDDAAARAKAVEAELKKAEDEAAEAKAQEARIAEERAAAERAEADAKARARRASSDDVLVPPKKVAPPKSAWRGSSLSYSQYLTALSVYEAAEPMYNPYWAHFVMVRPEYHFDDTYFTAVRFSGTQEFTTADDTKYAHEFMLNDVTLEAGGRFKDVGSGLNFNAGIQVNLPLSKVSQRATLNASFRPGAAISRKFDVLEGLTAAYALRGLWNANRYTRGINEGSRLQPCNTEDADPTSCAGLNSGGGSNTQFGVIHGASLGLGVTSTLSFSLDWLFFETRKYTQEDSQITIATGPVTVSAAGDQPWRRAQYVTVGGSWQAFDLVSFDFGAYNFYSSLGDDSKYRVPFFNRTITLTLGLSVDLDGAFASH